MSWCVNKVSPAPGMPFASRILVCLPHETEGSQLSVSRGALCRPICHQEVKAALKETSPRFSTLEGSSLEGSLSA